MTIVRPLNIAISEVGFLQVFHCEEACVDSLALDSEKVVQASARLIALRQFDEKLEQQRVLHHLLYALGLIYDFLDESFLDGHDSIVGHLRREIAEQPLDHQLKQVVNFEGIITLYLGLAVVEQEVV